MKKLADVANDIANLEEALDEKRTERNGLIAEARRLTPAPTLGRIAETAQVGVSYTSRVEKAKGKPASGSKPVTAAGKAK
jgi:hypothetical protein